MLHWALAAIILYMIGVLAIVAMSELVGFVYHLIKKLKKNK